MNLLLLQNLNFIKIIQDPIHFERNVLKSLDYQKFTIHSTSKMFRFVFSMGILNNRHCEIIWCHSTWWSTCTHKASWIWTWNNIHWSDKRDLLLWKYFQVVPAKSWIMSTIWPYM